MKSLMHAIACSVVVALALAVAGCANGLFGGPKPAGIPDSAHAVASGTPAQLNFSLAPGDTVLIYDNVTKKVISNQTASTAENVHGDDLVRTINSSASEGWDLNHQYTVYIVPAGK